MGNMVVKAQQKICFIVKEPLQMHRLRSRPVQNVCPSSRSSGSGGLGILKTGEAFTTTRCAGRGQAKGAGREIADRRIECFIGGPSSSGLL
jgi:hypothetical protein